MRFETGQHQRLEQRMKLAPRMIQSMEILQMPTLALAERIEQELASNPTLEMKDLRDDGEQVEADREQQERDDTEGERDLVVEDGEGADQDNADDFERLDNLSEQYGDSWGDNTWDSGGTRRRAAADGPDPKMEAMANTEARSACLFDQLLDQWRMVEAPADVHEAGAHLLGLIDADGYLRTPWNEVVRSAPRSVQEPALEGALAKIQAAIEPAGIGARDLRECLLLQIDARPATEDGADLADARRIVESHLPDVEANRLPKIAEATGWDLDRVKAAIHALRQFHPHPGRTIAGGEVASITPDARVWFDAERDRYVAELINDRLPGVDIVPGYAKMARDRSVDSSTRKFVSGNLRSARWLIEAIAQRQATLMRVIDVVLEEQRAYFDQGEQALRPLPMTDVADRLGIHVATVSRAVSEKYLQTPRGIIPLRMFFSGGTETNEGEQMSWTAVQARLKQLIDEEDKSDPLSDEALADKLEETGIDIARRTVAKYRKQLNIPTARRRREY